MLHYMYKYIYHSNYMARGFRLAIAGWNSVDLGSSVARDGPGRALLICQRKQRTGRQFRRRGLPCLGLIKALLPT